MKKYLPGGVLLLLTLALYLPTLRTGFLTDDFLDAQTTFPTAQRAFTEMMSSGYRPLMSYSWALDNWLWGTGRQWGWHLTNIFILAGALFSIRSFLKLFVKDSNAVLVGMALFAFCTPVAVSVAKTVWRTSLLPVIPLLWSMVFLTRYSRKERGLSALVFSSIFLLISLFLKEIALGVPPAFAVLAWSQTKGRAKTVFFALAASALPVMIYLTVRYITVGFAHGYTESAAFGAFMLKNILLLLGKIWTPWLSSLPARILLLLFGTCLWMSPWEKRLKVFLAVFSCLILLTVGNLSPRADYAVPAVAVFSLAVALFLQHHSSRRVYVLAILCLSAVFLYSADEVKLIKGASDSLKDDIERIAAAAEEIPGNGPLFLTGVQESFGGYGTFWPGEYMMPMRYAGIEPSRYIFGTDRIWEQLIQREEPGYLVFLDQHGGYRQYRLSPDMYRERSDTTVSAASPLIAGSLVGYPACRAPGPDERMILVSSELPDSLTEVRPTLHDQEWFFCLSAIPVWLTADSSTVIIADFDELVFTDRNVAEEIALEVLAAKHSVLRDQDLVPNAL